MEKHFIFKANKAIYRIGFEDALASIHIESEQVTYLDEYSGYFVSLGEKSAALSSLLLVLHDDLGLSISVLACHEKSDFTLKMAKEALDYFPNQVVFISDVLMKEISLGNYSSYKSLMGLFDHVPHELMQTAGTYLRCGLDACLSAKELFVHRNTFNYRLNQFIDLTHLDIRDYHNALLLELYFQLSNGYRN